jgi:hypothetical protein
MRASLVEKIAASLSSESLTGRELNVVELLVQGLLLASTGRGGSDKLTRVTSPIGFSEHLSLAPPDSTYRYGNLHYPESHCPRRD